MPAIIHCVRHAQGFHNLGAQFHGLPDPKLTPVGIEQCLALKNNLWANQSQISLITASPLFRTIQTAYTIFDDALTNGKAQNKILAIPDAQETSGYPCDTGSDVDVLKKIISEQHWPVDLQLVKEGWNAKIVGSRYAPSSNAIINRAKSARQYLREKVKEFEAAGVENPQIVLVSHGGYLHYFTEDWENSNKLMGTGWENCETRSYNFESENEDIEARLVETMESRNRRGIDHPMFPKEKQMELFRKSIQDWKDQGLQDASTFGETERENPDQSSVDRVEVEVAA